MTTLVLFLIKYSINKETIKINNLVLVYTLRNDALFALYLVVMCDY